MRLHYLQHVPFEDAAGIKDWAHDHGHPITCTQLYNGQELPTQDTFDALFVMGGPMNIYDHDEHPWLQKERDFLRQALSFGKAILGICLGAQLIADILGSLVSPNKYKEIGWHPVSLTKAARSNRLFINWPDCFEAFHWHGDTFQVPPGALHIATSEGCYNQAFVYGDRTVGLQFHLEYKIESLREMLLHCSNELQPGLYVQNAATIEAGFPLVGQTKTLLYSLLDTFQDLLKVK
ncbi:MAG: type 1 glutamine amidotransferase [Chloroflexota bacterium]|nr:type 1 glutamine amidotransferase [Chloroflexota bacterium]